MPLPSDEKLVQLANDLIAQLDAISGLHPGFRPAHAKGAYLTGVFTPSPHAASLTRAPHILRPSSPVTVRFSDSTGLPLIPDNNPNANPRGFAVRFHLGGRAHTDIIAHSADGFPTHTGAEFLEFLKAAVLAGNPTQPDPSALNAFLASHPAARAFIQTPKPSPASFATEAYFGVTAFRFTNAAGQSRFGRYRIVPRARIVHLDEAAAASQDPNYLFDELPTRLAEGPIAFDILVQVAAPEDTVDDATIHWPASRPAVPLGSLSLTALAPEDDERRRIIFDPIPRIDGIEASDDPLLELRAAVYLLSGRRRREADQSASATSA
jgi:catalase